MGSIDNLWEATNLLWGYLDRDRIIETVVKQICSFCEPQFYTYTKNKVNFVGKFYAWHKTKVRKLASLGAHIDASEASFQFLRTLKKFLLFSY